MENELAIQEENVVALVEGRELGDVLKPLIKEIHLFDSYVAGTTHLEDASVLQSIRVGDSLTLRREVNRYDDNAIVIMDEEKRTVGYVPEKDNTVFARLMDAGKLLKARITKIEDRGPMKQIAIGIYLVDY